MATPRWKFRGESIVLALHCQGNLCGMARMAQADFTGCLCLSRHYAKHRGRQFDLFWKHLPHLSCMEGGAYDFSGFLLDAMQVVRIGKAFGIDFINIFRSTGPGSEPPAGSFYLESS